MNISHPQPLKILVNNSKSPPILLNHYPRSDLATSSTIVYMLTCQDQAGTKPNQFVTPNITAPFIIFPFPPSLFLSLAQKQPKITCVTLSFPFSNPKKNTLSLVLFAIQIPNPQSVCFSLENEFTSDSLTILHSHHWVRFYSSCYVCFTRKSTKTGRETKNRGIY